MGRGQMRVWFIFNCTYFYHVVVKILQVFICVHYNFLVLLHPQAEVIHLFWNKDLLNAVNGCAETNK